MNHPAYMDEPWFGLLTAVAQRKSRTELADSLNVSRPLISQVLNGTGEYGSGRASTARFALRVMRTFGSFECPHRKANGYQNVVISADQCRLDALRQMPAIGAMRDLWLDCQKCPNRPMPIVPPKPAGRPRKAAADAKAPKPKQLALIPPDAPAPTPAKEPS